MLIDISWKVFALILIISFFYFLEKLILGIKGITITSKDWLEYGLKKAKNKITNVKEGISKWKTKSD